MSYACRRSDRCGCGRGFDSRRLHCRTKSGSRFAGAVTTSFGDDVARSRSVPRPSCRSRRRRCYGRHPRRVRNRRVPDRAGRGRRHDSGQPGAVGARPGRCVRRDRPPPDGAADCHGRRPHANAASLARRSRLRAHTGTRARGRAFVAPARARTRNRVVGDSEVSETGRCPDRRPAPTRRQRCSPSSPAGFHPCP